MGKSNILIFPVSKSAIPIVSTFHSFFPNQQFVLATLPGTALANHDFSFADNRSHTGWIVSENFNAALCNVDALLIPPGNITDPIHAETANIIRTAIKLKKAVTCCCTLDDDLLSDIQVLATEHRTHFSYYGSNHERVIPPNIHNSFFFESSVPVVMVCGLIEESNVFEIFLKLVAEAKRKGLNPLAFSSNYYVQALGLHNYPLPPNGLSESDKITYFNRFLEQLFYLDSPDIIIFHAPDPILRFSTRFPNGYGILTYMLTQAVRPDFAICCLQSYAGNIEKLVEHISRDTRSRLGFPINYFHLSNAAVDRNSLFEHFEMLCTHVPEKEVDELIANMHPSIPVYNLLSKFSFDDMVTDLFAQIKNNYPSLRF